MNPIFQLVMARFFKNRLLQCSKCGKMFYNRKPYSDEKPLCPDCKAREHQK